MVTIHFQWQRVFLYAHSVCSWCYKKSLNWRGQFPLHSYMTSWCVFMNGALLERKVVCFIHFSSAYNATSWRVVALKSLLYAGCVRIAPQSKIWIDNHQNLTHYDSTRWRQSCRHSETRRYIKYGNYIFFSM